MARRETAARRYADAAFQIGRQERTLDGWEGDLRALGDALANPELLAVVEHPAIPFAEKEAVIRRTVGSDVRPEAMNLVLLMVRRGRPAQIPRMIDRFGELLRAERGIALAEVRTARELEPQQRDAVVARLQELTGDRVEVNEIVDESLIGGIAVRIGDRLYDASVRSRLERLRARLTAV